MKKFFILLAASIICFACGSKSNLVAERVPIGDLYYNLYDNGTAEVVSEFSDFPYNDDHLWGEVIIPSSVQVKSATYTVTRIGDGAFAGCRSLTSVTIPNSVTGIGDHAFSCCISLTSVTIPNSVTGIGNYTFVFCKSLTSVTIPNSVTSIGNGAFDGSGITEPVYNAHVFAYLPKSYSGHYSIPEGIEQIADGAFNLCESLTSVTIPNSVTSIGWSAFDGCRSLTSVTIPNSVTSIGDWAFAGCESLTSITIPNSVTSIGNRAFDGCKSLTSVTIPDSVTSIGDWAFCDCESLTSVTIPKHAHVAENAFEGCSPNLQIKYEE